LGGRGDDEIERLLRPRSKEKKKKYGPCTAQGVSGCSEILFTFSLEKKCALDSMVIFPTLNR
jgi:hypothetical protein